MGEPREPDTQPDEPHSTDPSTRETEEFDLTRVAEEWRRQTREAEWQELTREAEEQRSHDAEVRQTSTRNAKDLSNTVDRVSGGAHGCLGCIDWLVVAVLLVVLIAARARWVLPLAPPRLPRGHVGST